MMRKYLFLVMVSLISTSLFAQTEENNQSSKAVIGISPVQLLQGLRIKYEKPLSNTITYGGILTGYYAGDVPGVQLAPIGRYYFKGTAPEGFYGQAKIVLGMHWSDYTSYTLNEYQTEPKFSGGSLTNGKPTDKTQTFFNVGGGIAVGYQLLWGKDNRCSIDINVGFKYVGDVPVPDDSLDSFEGFLGAVSTDLGWRTLGPGSFIDGLFSIGYRF